MVVAGLIDVCYNVFQSLLSLLLPQHTKLMQEINEILDVDLIKQQAKAGILDFQYYANYVISVMGKLCAPVRDDKIQELSQTTEIVPVFKGILETLESMHIDMANFTIKLMRPDLIARSIDYEKTKFAELLKIQPDGLGATRKWVLKHLDTVKASNPQLHSTDKDTIVRILTAKTIDQAYLELLQWDESMPFPETVMMDEGRFRILGKHCLRMTVVGAILLVTLSSIKQLQGNSAFKELLRQHVTVLLEEAHSNKDLEKLMPNVATQVIKDIDDSLKKIGSSELDVESKRLLSGQILEIASPSHKIRQLVCTRVHEFLHQSIASPNTAPLQVPPGLSSLQAELTGVTGQFLHLVSHNRAVYGEYYCNMVASTLA
uniref:T-complex protein 11-like protein 1 n=1 Tax=Timema douglasi TaxID=61478 RepID=A0A7R8ZCS8_TIMDO|nr:unnamed protein product [Timema douglasi]